MHDKLLDWLACAPKLDRLLCALYLGGIKGGGKNLFAHALSRIYDEGGACDIEKALDKHGSVELLRTAIVYADETVPKSWSGQSVTTKLRSLIGSKSHTIEPKHRPPLSKLGSVRLILGANNKDLLATKESMTGEDLAAIAQRFLFINVTQEAADYLESLPIEIRDSWRSQDLFAQHVLHLAQTREVQSGQRFWVEGDLSAMHRMLLTSNTWTGRVCEWIVRYLMNPLPFDTTPAQPLIRRPGDGTLYVNTQALIDGWRTYIKETRIDPETGAISKALGAIKKGRKQFRIRHEGPTWYFEIDMDHVLAWADEAAIGDRASMEKTLAAENLVLTPYARSEKVS